MKRATGRTTRLIDEAIQTLFREGSVTAVDHWFGLPGDNAEEANHNASRYMFRRLMGRLIAEHGPHMFEFNRDTFTVKLKQ